MRLRSKGRTMTSQLLSVLLMILLVAVKRTAAQTNDYNTRTVSCDTGQGTEQAYNSIESLQADIDDELDRLEAGVKEPEDSYRFVLCANTNFAFSEEEVVLNPVLDNINIQCGFPPRTSNECVFTGGFNQVFLSNTDDSNFPVERFTMTAVTFEEFTGAAIAGRASPNTEIIVIDPLFQNFNSTNIINQAQQTSNDPFRVRLIGQNVGGGNNPTIQNGRVSQSAFPVENTELDMEFVQVQNLIVAGDFISASRNEASVGVRDTILRESNVDAVVSLLQGADAAVERLTVADMEDIRRVVTAQNPGTQADLNGLQVLFNTNDPNSLENRWQYVEVINGASATVADSEFEGNNNVLYGFHAVTNSTLVLSGIEAIDNEGALDGTEDFQSSIVYASEDSVIELSDSIFTTTNRITSTLFSFSGSDIQSRRVCIADMPAMQSIVYSSFGSTMSIRADSAIENSPPEDQRVCPEEGERLMQESSANSACFLIPQNCTFECENWAAFNECALIPLRNETDAPTSTPTAPTDSPTTAIPTIAPSTLAPGSTAFPTVTPTTSAPTSPTSDQPSKVPTGSPAPTQSPGPTTETRSPTGRPTFNPDPEPGSPTRAPSSFPSSIPTIVQTSSPTTTTRSPTISPRPTTLSPTAGPTITPRPTTIPPTGRPTITAAPTTSKAPSVSPTTSQAPTITPRPTTSRPSSGDSSPAPTRCRIPPSKGKGKGVSKGKGAVRKERVLESSGWKYVYHYVYVEKPSDDDDSSLPICQETPQPAPAPVRAPYYWDNSGFLSKGKGYVAKGKGYEFLEKKSSKSNKSPKVRRNLEGKDGHQRREDLFSGFHMWYQQ